MTMRMLLTAVLIATLGCSGHVLPPTPTAPGKTSADAAAPGLAKGEASFDSRDLDRTWRWLLAEGEATEAAHGNDVAVNRHVDRVHQAFSGAKGQPVSWRVRVKKVYQGQEGRAGVEVAARTSPVSDGEHLDALTEASRAEMLGQSYPRNKLLFYRLRINGVGSELLHVPADDWVASLKPGDEVVLEGTFNAGVFKAEYSLPIYEWTLAVADHSLKPAK